MTNERAGYMSVQSGLLRETLVSDIFARADERREEAMVTEGAVTEGVAPALEADDLRLTSAEEPGIDHKLRRAGYFTRAVEVELFEPARQPIDWIPETLREHYARSGSWVDAVRDACAKLARAEPLEKPNPDDPAAASWRVPGPGGHVRHYVARRAIEQYLQDRERPVDGDPAELKRPWVYGFLVRACEEALPPEATLESEAAADPEG